MWWEKLKNGVLDTPLYSRSGTEVGVSEGALILKEKDGDYKVEKVAPDDIPEASYKASTDLGADYLELNRFVFGKLPESWLVGNYKKIFVGYYKDEEVRRNSSSGGIISGIQTYLLEKKEIEGAVTLRMRRDVPYLTEPIIATTAEEIFEAAQSKYTIAPMNQILSLTSQWNSLSYTGLPEQIASIRKLQEMGHPSVKPIKYILGFFYGETLGFGAVKSVLRAHGVKGPEEIKRLQFRAGEWPGNLQVDLKDGRVIKVPKFYANYLSPSHITKYSLYQADYMAELADISAGDAWAPIYEERGKGWSVVIARTDKGLRLLEDMMRDQKVDLKEISLDELINMHSLGLDVKKRGAFIRIGWRKAFGGNVPEYGYFPINISFKRKLFEAFSETVIWIFHRKSFIWLLEHLPVSFVGKMFVYARTIWKKSTKSNKKSGLEKLEFKINEK